MGSLRRACRDERKGRSGIRQRATLQPSSLFRTGCTNTHHGIVRMLKPLRPAPRVLCFDRATTLAQLRVGWKRVRANRGGPGGDGVTLERFGRSLERELADLAASLSEGSYRPGPLRESSMPKKNGGVRRLLVPCVADRVAQTAVMVTLMEALDARMADESFAYRPGRSVEHALALARAHIAAGLTFTVDADIERFFDNIPHRRLVHELAIWIDDPRLLALIGLWVQAFGPSGRGLPQGAPLSPLLANLYLHPFDRILAAAGIVAVRYADDLVLLCGTHEKAERARRIAAVALADRGLRLNPGKTRIVADAAEVCFLGQVLGPRALKGSLPPAGPRR